MILNIKPIRQEYFSCIDGVLATAAAYYERPYELMFIGSLGFKYDSCKEGENTFGGKLTFGIHNRSRCTLHRYHQIKVDWHKVDSYAVLNNLITENIDNGNPIGVFLDSFYCPWNPAFQKFHIIHYVLIIGYEDAGIEYYCFDPYISPELNKLSCEHLKNGFKEYIMFTKEPEADNAILLPDILKENFYSFENINRFCDFRDNILLFANDLRERLCIEDEISELNGDLKNSLLFRMIDMLGKHRTKFSISLQYASSLFKNDKLFALANDIAKSRGSWNSVNFLLYKLHFSGNKILQVKICDKLKEIAELEYAIQIKLTEFCETMMRG